MGVDYYQCHKCRTGFRDDSDYTIYCECGAQFCSKTCADPEFTWIPEGDDPDFQYEQCISCCICRVEHCSQYALLNFLLEHLNLTYEQAEKLYFEKNKK